MVCIEFYFLKLKVMIYQNYYKKNITLLYYIFLEGIYSYIWKNVYTHKWKPKSLKKKQCT
jgi:hypothetical protein